VVSERLRTKLEAHEAVLWALDFRVLLALPASEDQDIAPFLLFGIMLMTHTRGVSSGPLAFILRHDHGHRSSVSSQDGGLPH